MLKILEFLKGKKTNMLGGGGILLMLFEALGPMLGIDNLDLTVGEQLTIWLGSVGALTLRAAITKIEEWLRGRLVGD